MQFSTVFVAVICAVGIGMARGDAAGIQRCTEDFASKMSGMVADMMSGDVAKLKEKMCPMVKNFFKCAMSEASEKRPTEEQLEDLKKQLSSSTASMQQIDCQIDVNQLADEVWSAAGAVRSWSLLALAAAALAAMFVSRKF